MILPQKRKLDCGAPSTSGCAGEISGVCLEPAGDVDAGQAAAQRCVPLGGWEACTVLDRLMLTRKPNISGL